MINKTNIFFFKSENDNKSNLLLATLDFDDETKLFDFINVKKEFDVFFKDGFFIPIDSDNSEPVGVYKNAEDVFNFVKDNFDLNDAEINVITTTEKNFLNFINNKDEQTNFKKRYLKNTLVSLFNKSYSE